MTEDRAIQKMIPPGAVRPGKWRGGVIQIWVTRACDKSCFGCTQGSNLAGNPGMITPENFELAVKSLRGYFGVVGIFGGNPAMHPQFSLLCEILAAHIPRKQRGLWCNNPLGHGAKMRATFNPDVSNLNVHLDAAAYDEFKRDWPESRPVGLRDDSRHAPPYVAIQDVIENEGERWDLISNCDINKHWSAMIGQFRGQVRAWFCEIAGAQAMLHQHEADYPDEGLHIGSDGLTHHVWTEGTRIHDETTQWWKLPMSAFREQVRKHCMECGVPLRGYGELACSADGTEQYSRTHASVFKPKRKERNVELVQLRTQLGPSLSLMTDYLGNAKR